MDTEMISRGRSPNQEHPLARMGDIAPASQVTINGSRSRVWRELACAIFGQVRDVPYSRSFREVEERGNRRSEVHPHERREHIQALNPLNGSRMGSRVVPVELGVGEVSLWTRPARRPSTTTTSSSRSRTPWPAQPAASPGTAG